MGTTSFRGQTLRGIRDKHLETGLASVRRTWQPTKLTPPGAPKTVSVRALLQRGEE